MSDDPVDEILEAIERLERHVQLLLNIFAEISNAIMIAKGLDHDSSTSRIDGPDNEYRSGSDRIDDEDIELVHADSLG